MKYAILGIGQVGLRHFNAFKRIKNLSLIGFIEKNSKKANSFEKKFKIKQYKNLNKLLSFVKSMDKWKHPEAVVNRYKIDKELIRKDIEELEHWTKHQGKKRSHLTEIKNRLKIIYTILENNDFSSTKKDEFVYTLFCEFEFEDYGKGGNDYIKVEGEISDFEAKQREKVKKIRLDCEKYPKGWL